MRESAPGGVGAWSRGCVSGPGGCLIRGDAWFWGGVPACTEADPPCEQNDRQVQKYYLGHNFVAAGNNTLAPPGNPGSANGNVQKFTSYKNAFQ